MRLQAFIAAALLITQADAAQVTADQCKARIDAQIKPIDEEMKRGYREPRGNQLREKRKKLNDLRYECNSNPAAWEKARKL